VRAVILVALGLTVRNRERLPKDGPAVIAGNHNSNLDALAMMSLMPLRLLSKLRPVAAMDYFYSSKLRGWFADNIVGIIPVKRGSGKEGGNPLLLAEQALDRGEILAIFPEGTRGEPETLQAFKKGIGRVRTCRCCRYSCMASARRCRAAQLCSCRSTSSSASASRSTARSPTMLSFRNSKLP
jgi:1-acyl-sn-glycerol-3-phosphate acyltransferase